MSGQRSVDPELFANQIGQSRAVVAAFGLEDPSLYLLLLALEMPTTKRGKGALQ
jgi:hypothetical protein